MRLVTNLFLNAQKSQKKEVRDMMRKYLSIIAVVLITVFSATGLQAHGTAAGSIVSNAVLSGTQDTNTATALGALSGAFTNDSGSIFFAMITNTTAVTTHVDPGYDMSHPLQISLNTQNGSAGSYVDYEFYITNWGNTADNIRLAVTNLGDNFGAAFTYELYTNSLTSPALASGASILATYPALAPDSELHVFLRVNIPSSAPNNSTNRIFASVEDSASSGASTGDAWPGIYAIAPATNDLSNNRDYQSTSDWLVIVAGPVIHLSKSVDLSSARPYEDLTYTIQFTNAGSATAENLVIQDVIPNHSYIVADSAEGAGTFNGHAESAAFSVSYNSNGTWTSSVTADNSDSTLIKGVRWTVSSNIAPGNYGTVTFKVRIR